MADGRSNNGGKRVGAGRKPKSDEMKLIEKLSPLEPLAFEALKKGLEKGDGKFVKLFMEYMYGKPHQSLDMTSNGQELMSAIKVNVISGAGDSSQ